jgi:hypothetical protein
MANRIQQITSVQKEALALFTKKNADYGDSFATFGPIGVIVRMQDKINRLINISTKQVSFVKDESLRDTLIDLHNYSAMAIMLMDEESNQNFKSIKTDIDLELGQPKTPEQYSMNSIEENGFYGC